MKLQGKLDSGIVGNGFLLKRGYYTGELDEFGILWMTVLPTGRMPGGMEPVARRIGVPASRFTWLEAATVGNPSDKRSAINAQIKAAEKAARERAAKS